MSDANDVMNDLAQLVDDTLIAYGMRLRNDDEWDFVKNNIIGFISTYYEADPDFDDADYEPSEDASESESIGSSQTFTESESETEEAVA